MSERNNLGVGLIVAGVIVEVVANGWLSNDNRGSNRTYERRNDPPPQAQRRLVNENEGDRALEAYEKTKKKGDEKNGKKEEQSWYSSWLGGGEEEEKKEGQEEKKEGEEEEKLE